ncbi:MAG: ParB/Srx family N-terminal domain-containing protein [Gammaproteobacteria bacterium]|nr:ParB/Srx family N-terminal domain-containing protein [Gammaproteobacteria bacterium]
MKNDITPQVGNFFKDKIKGDVVEVRALVPGRYVVTSGERRYEWDLFMRDCVPSSGKGHVYH